MGRKKTTGKFESREDLVNFICDRYHATPLGNSEIGRMAQVSERTVANILDGEEGKNWYRLYKQQGL